MDFGRGKAESGDPLERRVVGKAIVVGAVLVAMVAFVFSAKRADPVPLPGVALDSPFLLDMERSAVAAALVVGAAVFLIRGWVGYFPSKLSTTGAEYATRSTAERAVESGDRVADALAQVKLDQMATAESTRAEIRAVKDGLAVLAREMNLESSGTDDMV